ncbi:glycogenin glucosyltransferase GLG1 [Saccharomyces eubayanus]|uniref:glycogenin glucosyltransferase GLG1 n=1 Tax=Saccharomyces eubayanus TaxID=1080349 RepID=UPI0006C70189|nr:GLG1-like protein [Saccharomyces eubayanus]KOG98371.1 GLG1-like protein [Saccharomyces eubayanus]
MCRKLAIVTLLYSADYLPGVFALGHQVNKLLKEAGRKDRIDACLVVTTPLFNDILSDLAKDLLKTIYDDIVLVNPLECQDESIQRNSENLALLERPELSFALIKARLWELTQYEQVLYLDSDTLPLNKDFLRLFDIMSKQTKLQIGAVADIGWPDMFNSGVMMLIPDADTASVLQNYVIENTSIDGADQGILNQFFNQNCCTDELLKESFPREWVQLSFTYNVTTPNLGYESSPAMNYFKPTIKLIHFIGQHKPWSLWSQTNFVRNEYNTQWNGVYEEFKQENKLVDDVSKIDINDFNEDNNVQTASQETIPQTASSGAIPQDNDFSTEKEVETIDTKQEDTRVQLNEPAPVPVPLDFTEWLTTFINKDNVNSQAMNKMHEHEGNDSGFDKDDAKSDEDIYVNNSDAKPDQESIADKNDAKSDQDGHVNNNDSNPDQESHADVTQDPITYKDDISEDIEPPVPTEDDVKLLEQDEEGYDEFLPDVCDADAINNEEGEDFDVGKVGRSVEDALEKENPTEDEPNNSPQEMPNFRFDWEDSDYLSKVERYFPDDVFEYAVE